MRISRTCWICQGYSLKFKDQQPHGQWRCCVAYGQGQHGGVDASERRRKCELAGIFYSCEYVHRAVRAMLQSASAPYLEAFTIGLLVILLPFTAHSDVPFCVHYPTTHPSLLNPSIPALYAPLPPQPILSQPPTHPCPPNLFYPSPPPTSFLPNSSIPAHYPSLSPQRSLPRPTLFLFSSLLSSKARLYILEEEKKISSPLSHFKTAWIKKKNLSNLLCLNGTRYKGRLSWKYYANSQIWRRKIL